MQKKQISFLLPSLFVAETKSMGRGVFTKADIEAGTLVELSPVILMDARERHLIDQTLLHDYIFEWGDDAKSCCMALGFIAVYNHAYLSNCEYEMYFKKNMVAVKAVRKIEAGEELFINYNGDWNNTKPLWFDAK